MKCPAPANGSRRLIQECVRTTAAVRRRRVSGRSKPKGPRPRRYLSTRRATPQTKIAVETAIRQYQKTISHVERPAKVARVGVTGSGALFAPERSEGTNQSRGKCAAFCAVESKQLLEFLRHVEEVGDRAVVGDVEDRGL